MDDEDVVIDRDDLSTHHAGLVSLLLDLGVKTVMVDEDQERAHIFYHNINTPPITVIL